jgi:hypothetical protein
MNNTLHDKIQTLIKTLDLTKINLNLIKTNSAKLLKVWKELEKIFFQIKQEQINYNVYTNADKKYTQIIGILEENFLSSNSNIKNIIIKSQYIHCLSYMNIYFFWLSNSDIKNLKSKDYLMSLNMFKISLCLNQYKYDNSDTIPRYIIWIPIEKKRDFKYNKISKNNLKKTQEDFEAFVASGVTFGLKPRITIITRYEEVEKLLIHELIHNYNIDGSGYHNKLNNILTQYEKIKNTNYHYEYSIYESYTELLSTYFYLIFENINTDTKLTLDKIMGQILVELIYSYNVVANLIDLNGYSNYDEFKNKKFFAGTICKYEYYYIKALMYNNFILNFGYELNDFISIYTNIIEMIGKIQKLDDPLMEIIYNNRITNTNFKYQIH